MEKNWMALMQQEGQLSEVKAAGRRAEAYGLSLSERDVRRIVEAARESQREQGRLELGGGIAGRIIAEFCDSAYLTQENYAETIIRLQAIFYLYKNEMDDEITDDELLHLMREQYDNLCFGDLDYLEGTCLSDFARAIRAGYAGFQASEGYGEYGRFDDVPRWDRELYLDALKERLG